MSVPREGGSISSDVSEYLAMYFSQALKGRAY
jgi:hypothetical protein